MEIKIEMKAEVSLTLFCALSHSIYDEDSAFNAPEKMDGKIRREIGRGNIRETKDNSS